MHVLLLEQAPDQVAVDQAGGSGYGNERELESFGRHMARLRSDGDYDALLECWGVHRTDPRFWRISDKFHRMIASGDPVEAGLLVYSRYHASPASGDDTHRAGEN